MRKIPTMRGARIKKAALWGMLATSTIAGTSVLALWASGEFNISTATPIAVERKQQEVSQAARSFAIQFAHEYFKWVVGQPDRRAERLKPFLAQGMDPQAGLNFSALTRHARPEHVTIWKEEVKGNGEFVITVAALVSFYDTKDSSKFFSKRMLLAIPVKEKNERDIAVVQNPRLVPLPGSPSIQSQKKGLNGKQVDPATEREIRSAAEVFFKTYTSGESEELAYLTDMDQPLPSFQGAISFDEIEQFEAVKKGDWVVSDVLVRLVDSNTGMTVSVPYRIEWIKKDGRWFVSHIQ